MTLWRLRNRPRINQATKPLSGQIPLCALRMKYPKTTMRTAVQLECAHARKAVFEPKSWMATLQNTHKTRVKSQSMDTTQQICEINPVRLQNKSSLQHPAVVPKRHVSTQLPFLARPFKLIAKKQFWKTSRSQGLRFLVNPNERALASIAIASVFMVVYCQWVLPNMHATVAKYAGHAF